MGGRRCSILFFDDLIDAVRLLPLVTVGNKGLSTIDKIDAAYEQMNNVRRLRDEMETRRSGIACRKLGGCWLSACSDPRDKIYAILGVLQASEAAEIPVDYSMSWQKLYELVARCLVRWGQGPEMLIFAGIDTSAAGSPSWVLNWFPSMTGPQRHCSPLSQPGRYYCAGGQAQAQISLSQCGSVFRARGMIFDDFVWLSDIATAGAGYRPWETSAGEEVSRLTRYQNGKSISAAYQMTLVAGLGLFGEERVNQEVLSEAYEAWRDTSWNKHGSTWKYYNLYDAWYSEFYDCSLKAVGWRRLCITERGYIGLVPSNTKLGDCLAVFPGFQTPWVLRLRGCKYVLVGESYIHGIMEGEALERSDALLEWISIY